MKKVRIYTICYRNGARRHFDCSKNDICSAIHYIRDVNLIERYRVQIVSGDNKILLFDSASIYHDPSVFDLMCQNGYHATYWRMLEQQTTVMADIIDACKRNAHRNKQYKTLGYLSVDRYC